MTACQTCLGSYGIGYTCPGCGVVGTSVDIFDRFQAVCADRDRLRAENERMRGVMRRLIECYDNNEIHLNHPPTLGPHNDIIECPEDDTCECVSTWVINEAARLIDSATKEQP